MGAGSGGATARAAPAVNRRNRARNIPPPASLPIPRHRPRAAGGNAENNGGCPWAETASRGCIGISDASLGGTTRGPKARSGSRCIIRRRRRGRKGSRCGNAIKIRKSFVNNMLRRFFRGAAALRPTLETAATGGRAAGERPSETGGAKKIGFPAPVETPEGVSSGLRLPDLSAQWLSLQWPTLPLDS